MDIYCVVPGCNSETPSEDGPCLIKFPRSKTLCDRWEQAITTGTGVIFQRVNMDPEDRLGGICSWHFGDEPMAEYREPRRFFNLDDQVVEVVCCRLCLEFQNHSATVPNDSKLGKHSIDSFVKQVLKVPLIASSFLRDVCYKCLAKIDLCKSWLQDVRKTEAEFRSILVDASNEPGLNDDSWKYSYDLIRTKEEMTEYDEASFIGLKVEILDTGDISDNAMPQTDEEGHVSDTADALMEEIHQPKKKRRGRPPKVGANHRRKKDKPPREVTAATLEDEPLPKEKRPARKRTKVDYKNILLRKCYICDTLLDDKLELVGHLTQVHAAKVDYHCEECDKTLKSVLSFNHHLSFHDAVHRPLKCSYCPVRFCVKNSLLIHENHKHNANNVLPKKYPRVTSWQCDTCGKTFRNVTRLREHDDFYHKNVLKATCVICKKAFPTRSLLLKHQLSHSDERTYKCEHCGESFKKSTCLSDHMRKHQANYKEWKAQRKKPPSAFRRRHRVKDLEEESMTTESDTE